MFGEKRKRDEFCNTEWKIGKTEFQLNDHITEFTEDEALFGFMREPPSLQRIASISAAIRLWTRPDFLKNFYECSNQLHWAADMDHDLREKAVKKELAEMIFPNSLKVNISNLIRPIGLQLNSVFDGYTSDYLYDLFKDTGLFYWTMQGTIDESKSLRTLIRSQNQSNNNIHLFKTTCKYCLDDCISDLWEKMSSDITSSYKSYYNHLDAYWLDYLRNQLSTFLCKIKPSDHLGIYDLNCSIHQNMVSLSIFELNVNSLKYFWYKLTEEEKTDNIKKWLLLTLKQVKRTYGWFKNAIDVVCFLLPHLRDKDELKEIFQKNDCKQLMCGLFLSWPQNQLFLSTLNMMMMLDCLPADDYPGIIMCVMENIEGHEDLFRKICFSSPIRYKKSLINFITIHMSPFMVRDWGVEIFHVILNISSSAEKKNIMLRMITMINKKNCSDVLNIISTFVPKTVLADQDLFKMGILLNSNFVRKLLHYAGVQTAEQFVGLGLQALNEIQNFQKKKINVRELYEALVIIGNKEYIDKFLKWFYESEHEIVRFKVSILNCPLSKWFPRGNSEEDLWHLKDIITECSKRWEMYEKLIHDSFCSSEEIALFKKDHLSDVIDLIKDEDFEFALLFLSWFFNSIEDVKVKVKDASKLYEAILILGNFDYLEPFLKLCIKTENGIINFPKSAKNQPLDKWFSSWNLKYLMPECCIRWKVYEKLIHHRFCSPGEIEQFKKDHFSDVISFVRCRDFEFALMFLSWFFISIEGIEVKVMNASILYEAMIILGNFDYVEQFLKLQFEKEDEMINFKNSIINCPINQWFSNWNLKRLIYECSDRWKVYEKLISYSFCSSEEIAQFKEKQAGNAVSLVEQGDSELASMFLSWCFQSINYLMSPEFFASLICGLSSEIKIVKDLIKWFSPTPMDAENLKILIREQTELSPKLERQRGQALIYLLDCFSVKGNKSVFFSTDFEDDDVVKDILKGNLSMY